MQAAVIHKIATDFHFTERCLKEMTVAFVDIGVRSAMRFLTADLRLFPAEIASVFRWVYDSGQVLPWTKEHHLTRHKLDIA
jgi:hypothetical protein